MKLNPIRYPSVEERPYLDQHARSEDSAHAYVRGNTIQFYEWLDALSLGALPQGPAIWICGDCHIGNLGPVADANGRMEIEIRDLDQTVIGNPAHDLVRLGLSLASAARGSDLLKHGDAFAVFDEFGDIGHARDGPEGIYFNDTRFLSWYELRFEGKRPLLLSSVVQDDNAALSVHLANPDVHVEGFISLPRDTISSSDIIIGLRFLLFD